MWESEETPQIDIDIMLVLDEYASYEKYNLGMPTILGIELRYFTSRPSTKNFYAGLDQALAYFRLGVDKSGLLYVFNGEIPENYVKKITNATDVLVRGLKLPISYVLCRLLSIDGFGRFKVYSIHAIQLYEGDICKLVTFLKQGSLNPLIEDILFGDNIRRLRSTLMAKLGIPVMRT